MKVTMRYADGTTRTENNVSPENLVVWYNMARFWNSRLPEGESPCTEIRVRLAEGETK